MNHPILDHRLGNLPASIWEKIALVDELKGRWAGSVRLSPQVLGRLKQSVLVTSTGASTRIEGARLSDDDIEKLFSPRQLAVWRYLQSAPEVTPKDLSQELGIPRPTINQVLNRLLDLDKIERIGLGRSTRYRIK